MDVMGWAANQAAQKKSNRLAGWLRSDAGDGMLMLLGLVAIAAVLAI